MHTQDTKYLVSRIHSYICMQSCFLAIWMWWLWYTRNSYLSYILNLNISAFLLIMQLHPSIYSVFTSQMKSCRRTYIIRIRGRKHVWMNVNTFSPSFRSVPFCSWPHYKYCGDIINSPKYWQSQLRYDFGVV